MCKKFRSGLTGVFCDKLSHEVVINPLTGAVVMAGGQEGGMGREKEVKEPSKWWSQYLSENSYFLLCTGREEEIGYNGDVQRKLADHEFVLHIWPK